VILPTCDVCGERHEPLNCERLADAEKFVSDALFLRQYGERPPGAPADDPDAETWGAPMGPEGRGVATSTARHVVTLPTWFLLALLWTPLTLGAAWIVWWGVRR